MIIFLRFPHFVLKPLRFKSQKQDWPGRSHLVSDVFMTSFSTFYTFITFSISSFLCFCSCVFLMKTKSNMLQVQDLMELPFTSRMIFTVKQEAAHWQFGLVPVCWRWILFSRGSIRVLKDFRHLIHVQTSAHYVIYGPWSHRSTFLCEICIWVLLPDVFGVFGVKSGLFWYIVILC